MFELSFRNFPYHLMHLRALMGLGPFLLLITVGHSQRGAKFPLPMRVSKFSPFSVQMLLFDV